MFLDYVTEGDTCIDLQFDPCTGNSEGDPLKDAAFWSLFVHAESSGSCQQFRDGYWADPTQGVDRSIITGGTTNEVIASSEDALKRALNWMISDGVALEVNVTSSVINRIIVHEVEIVGPNICRFSIAAIKNRNQWVWNEYS